MLLGVTLVLDLRTLRQETLASLIAAAANDRSAIHGLHAGTKAELAFPRAFGWLVGPLHMRLGIKSEVRRIACKVFGIPARRTGGMEITNPRHFVKSGLCREFNPSRYLSSTAFHGLIASLLPTMRFFYRIPLLALACLLAACDPPQGEGLAEGAAGEFLIRPGEDGRKEIVLLVRDLLIPFDLAQSHILQTLGSREAGYEITVEDAAGSVVTQAKQLQAAILRRPEAILLDPIADLPLDPILVEALAANVRVISLRETLTPPRCFTSVFCPEAEVGKIAGQMVIEALERKAQEDGHSETTGRVVEIRGSEEDPGSQARHQGFVEALSKQNGIIVVHDAPGGWTRDSTKAVLADAYRLQHQFDVVYAHDDTMAWGASELAADQERREDTFILGTNGYGGPDAGQDLMRRGDIDATIFHPIPADLAWSLVLKLKDDPGFSPKPEYRLKAAPITHANLSKVRNGGLPPYPKL